MQTALEVTGQIKIGDGATEYVGSDCYPYTVIGLEANSNGNLKYIVVQADTYVVFSGSTHEGTATYTYGRNSQGVVLILRQNRKTKQWQTVGKLPFSFGARRYYRDPSF